MFVSRDPIDAFPGPSTPALLQLIQWGTQMDSYWNRHAAQYGSPFRVRWPFFYDGRVVAFTTRSAAMEVLRLPADVAHAGEAYRLLTEGSGPTAMIVQDEEPHARLRKLVLPPLHGERLARWQGFARERISAEIDQWKAGDELTLRPIIERAALDVIMKIVFGVRDSRRAQQMHDLSPAKQEVTVVQGLGAFTKWARADLGPWSPWGRFVRTRDAFRRLIEAEIGDRRAEHAAGLYAADSQERANIMSMLLDARDDDGQPMADEELRDQLVLMLQAGHETTATSISWALERLVRHPDVVRRLRERLDEGDTTYLDAVVKETLRVRPVVAQLGRVTTREVVVDGWTVPARTMLIIPMSVIHKDPEIYPDPEAFRPERFLEEDGDPGRYGWLPFGGGVRRCPGSSLAQMEMQIFVEEIVRRVELEPVDPRDERPRVKGITLMPERGCRLRVMGLRSAPESSDVALAA